jgi:hypothetical protein
MARLFLAAAAWLLRSGEAYRDVDRSQLDFGPGSPARQAARHNQLATTGTCSSLNW